MSFWKKLIKAIATESITVSKVKGKYQTQIDATLFGMNLYSLYRKSSTAEKKSARETAKLIASEAVIKIAGKKFVKKVAKKVTK